MPHTPLIHRTPRHVLATLLLALAAAQAQADGCAMPGWDGRLPALAPTLTAGTTWTYSSGEAATERRLRLAYVTESEAVYALSGNGSLVENWMTATEVNSRRDGEKVLLGFPLNAGKSWTDSYSEPGVLHTPSGDYRYTYNETATSTVSGVEDIAVGAGRFRTVQVDRIAHWVKDHLQILPGPQEAPLPPDGLRVEGYTHTRLWYAPRVGRVVRQATLSLPDGHQGMAPADLIDNPAARVSELVAYHGEETTCPQGAPVNAHTAADGQHGASSADPAQQLRDALRWTDHLAREALPGRIPAR